jgi:regulator of RNase E activity RraA
MPALKPETRALLLQVGVAVLTNGLLKRGLRNQFLHGIVPVAPDMPAMAGPAFTLRFIPAREDIDTLEALRRPDNVQRRALEVCPPGGVLVIDTGNNARSASAGDLMIGRLKVRGCAGIVTDGGFRDIAEAATKGSCTIAPAIPRPRRSWRCWALCDEPRSTAISAAATHVMPCAWRIC